MNKKLKIFIILCFILIPTVAFSQTWDELAKKTVQAYRNGDYKNGFVYAKLAIEKAIADFGKNHNNYAISLSNLALIYKSTGKYDEAEPLYLEALNIIKNNIPYEKFSYAITIDNLGNLYFAMGRYSEAEDCYKESTNILKQYKNGEHFDYASSLNNLAILYKETGRLDEGIELFKEAIRIFGKTLGKNHPLYAIALDNLATAYNLKGKYKEAEPLLKKAIDVFRINYGKNHIDYLKSINNLGVLYYNLGRYNEAEKLLQESVEIHKVLYGENSCDYAISLNNLGILYTEINDFKNAELYLNESIRIIKEITNENHPTYTTSLLNLGLFYQKIGNLKKAEECYLKSAENNLYNLYKYFPALSEKEKLQYTKTIEYDFYIFNSFLLEHGNNNVYDKMLDLSLATKGIVLNSTSIVRERIKKSKNEELINLYQQFLSTRELISYANNLTKRESLEKGINIDSLEKVANQLEKELNSKSEFFYKETSFSNTSWRNIKEKLNYDEAAVEINNFRYFNNKWTDTVWYCAFIIRKDLEFPIYVKLSTESEIKQYLEASPATNFSYVRNPVKAKELYNKIFKPIEKHLIDINKVYISLAGSLNRISYSLLRTEDDKLLLEKYNLHFYNNLRELTTKKPSEDENIFNDNFLAVVFGGAKFDLDTAEIKSVASKYKSLNKENFISERGIEFIIDENTRGNVPKWNYLPGTLEEANLISDIFKSKNFNVETYTGAEASEDVLKNIVTSKPVTILHIATHGYFFPQQEEDFKNINMLGTSTGITIRTAKNPLLRSGILFSGANLAWSEGKKVSGAGDGILTALDVSNLDLFNTELVVLSACETGLGDIKSGEGVFGLQRAFKIAGTKSIIMSLWKVPDKQTVELMKMFYLNWIEGLTKFEAFRKAQLQMNSNYPRDPYLWGAFFLVE